MPSVSSLFFRSSNLILRLYDTFTADTNWPKFRHLPSAAVIRSMPRRRVCSLLARFVFFWSFCCTAFSVVVDPAVVVDAVVVLVFEVDDFVLVVPDVLCVLAPCDVLCVLDPCVELP